MELYHGSTKIIRKPEYGAGRKHNDYGLGFYCTEHIELAGEWACSSIEDGIINHYNLDDKHLNILRLNSEDFSILNWMAVLVTHRLFRPSAPIATKARRYLEENFLVNVNAYDVVIGYRADDRYYDFADAFLNNTITVEQLAKAMRLGKLGEQIAIKSEYAFGKLSFIDSRAANKEIYYPRRKARDEKADNEFIKICESEPDGLYMIDIMRGGIGNDDARIPRNLSE